jgi:cytochrome c
MIARPTGGSLGVATALAVATLVTGLLSGCGKGGAKSGPAPDPEAQRLLADLPPAYRSADLANGKLHFSLCRACHTLIAGAPDTVGPNLHGVFGRRAGSKGDYSYSDALKAAGFTWDAARLDRWLQAPQSYLPGTKMSFVGIKDAKDRSDLIAYLRVASSRNEP